MISIAMATIMYLTTLFTPQCSQPDNVYAGIGMSNTHTLTVSSPWELSWQATGVGNFYISAYNPSSKKQLGIVYTDLKSGSRYGSTVVHDISGTIYLTVDGSVDVTWVVKVK